MIKAKTIGLATTAYGIIMLIISAVTRAFENVYASILALLMGFGIYSLGKEHEEMKKR